MIISFRLILMRVNKIKIVDYRNYQHLEIDLQPGINVFYGFNGQGKTNFVEAVHYLSSLKSFRSQGDNDLIRKGQEGFLIQVDATIDKRSMKLKVVYHEENRKLFIDDSEVKRNQDFYELFHSLIFSPLDVTLFIDIPERRRKFIDKELCKISPAYAFTLSRFKSILKERNALLKDGFDEVYLEVLTKQISELSDFIVTKRQEFTDELRIHASKIFKNLYDNEEVELDIEYLTYRQEEGSYHYYSNNLREDIARQKTCIGPHLDDIRVNLNKLDIAKFGSQGQQRLAILAIKLGLLDVYEKASDDRVVVILDDVLSELDEQKRRKIFTYFDKEYQVLITTANLNDIKYEQTKNIHCYQVDNGIIKGEKL